VDLAFLKDNKNIQYSSVFLPPQAIIVSVYKI